MEKTLCERLRALAAGNSRRTIDYAIAGLLQVEGEWQAVTSQALRNRLLYSALADAIEAEVAMATADAAATCPGCGGELDGRLKWCDVCGEWVATPTAVEVAPTDTQERIDEDKAKSFLEYWGCEGIDCGECLAVKDGLNPKGQYGVSHCSVAMGMDIARRQAELDAREGGDAR